MDVGPGEQDGEQTALVKGNEGAWTDLKLFLGSDRVAVGSVVPLNSCTASSAARASAVRAARLSSTVSAFHLLLI